MHFNSYFGAYKGQREPKKIWKEITQKIISMFFMGHAISRCHEFTNKKLALPKSRWSSSFGKSP